MKTSMKCVGLAAGGLVLCQATLAAEEPLTLEEVLVTAENYVPSGSRSATKSDAPLIETPQSVTVITRDQIDLLNWTSLQQSVRYTAGVVGENFGPDERYDWLTVRGFTPVQYIDGLQAPVGSVNNVGTDLYGSESVDILKGPSSVLYGQTPPGGIVNMTSRRPERELGGELELQFGNREHSQVNGDITGALTERLSGRFTALYRDRETQVEGVSSERTYVAPALAFDISERTRLTLLAYYQDDEILGDGGGFLPAYGTSLPNPLGKVPVDRNLGDTEYNSYTREQYGVGYDFSHTFNDTLMLEQNLKFFSADAQMRSVYGAGLLDADFDGVPDDYRTVNRYNFPFDEEVESFNVDTRLYADFTTGTLEHNLMLGVDYRDYDNTSVYGFDLAPSIDLFAPEYGMDIETPAFQPYADQQQKQVGYYVQDQIHLGSWVLTLAGRQDELDSENFGSDTSDSEFTYRVGLNYLFENGLAPYLQVAKSFQPISGADFFGTPFAPSVGEQVEGGLKYQMSDAVPDLDLFATLAAYDLTQKDVLTPDPDPTHPFFDVQTGEVEVEGVELELVARWRERLSVNASYSHTDSEVTKSNGPDLGKALPMVPEDKASLLVDYTFQQGALAGLGLGLGVRYLSSSYGDPANEWQNESVTLYDGILRYDMPNWSLALNANNLGDEIYVARCSSAIDCFYGVRRSVNASLIYHF